jgi:uncharacterized membrane protein
MIPEPIRSKWMKTMLVISCVLNIFLGGVVTGIVTGWYLPPMISKHLPHLSSDVAMMLMNRLVSGLSQGDQDIIRDSFVTRKVVLSEKIGAARLAKLQVLEALTAEPFDSAKLDAALQNLNSKMAAIPLEMRNILMEVAPRLSNETRHKLAERIRMASFERRGAF